MSHKRTFRSVVLQIAGVLILLAWPASAKEGIAKSSAVESKLNSTFRGKILILRNFYEGSKFEFGADGTLLHGGKPGYWTTDAKVEIKGFKVRPSDLEIEGNRVWFRYDQEATRFLAYSGPAVRIKIRLNPGAAALENCQASIGRVFHGEHELLSDMVPDHWRAFFSKDSKTTPYPPPLSPKRDPMLSPQESLVTPPVAKYKPEPPYTSAARESRIEGTVVVYVVVNTEGIVTDPRVVKPMGLGLDDQAVATIKTWTFTPGTKDGQPTNVKVLIEVQFRLSR